MHAEKPRKYGLGTILWVVAGGLVGAVPGILCFRAGAERAGVAGAILGAFIGAMLTLPGVSAGRALRLFVGLILAYNAPVSRDRLADWVHGEEASAEDEPDSSDQLLEWLLAPDARPRRGGLVLAGLCLGLVVGAWICITDCDKVRAGGDGWLLPFCKPRDALMVQSAMATTACGIWGAGLAGIFASAGYRRPILFTVAMTGALTALIMWGWGSRRIEDFVGFSIIVTTIVLGTVFVCLAALEFDDEQE